MSLTWVFLLFQLSTKKSLKWKLSRKSSRERSAPSPCPDEPSSPDGRQMSATASNVTNLIMGLNPPQYQSLPVNHEESSYARGRRAKGQHSNYSNDPYIERLANNIDNCGTSPTSTRSGPVHGFKQLAIVQCSYFYDVPIAEIIFHSHAGMFSHAHTISRGLVTSRTLDDVRTGRNLRMFAHSQLAKTGSESELY